MSQEEKKSDAMTAEEAKKTRLLIKEDIAKLKLAKQQALAQVQVFDARIAECELGLADIDRREAGVAYPEPPQKPAEPPKPQIGKPVGPGAGGGTPAPEAK